jgi:hypothetical protein
VEASTITDATTLGELSAALSEVKASVRMASRKGRRGSIYTVVVEWPGGNASLNNTSLGAAMDCALALLRLQNAESMEPAEPDPNGARVGPAPERDGTRVGRPSSPLHCFACGYGESEGERYRSDQPCPKCGEVGKACALPPGHEEDHDLHDGIKLD